MVSVIIYYNNHKLLFLKLLVRCQANFFLLQNMEREIINSVSDEECMNFNSNLQYLDPFQSAQDPLEGFTEEFLKMQSQPKSKKTSQQRRNKMKCKTKKNIAATSEAIKSNKYRDVHSFVINSAPKKGLRLIKIQVIQMDGSQRVSDCVNDDCVVLSSQYVVKDVGDEIMDQTEKIISNISKKICGYSYTSCF